jgi:hypothetical protein
MTKRNPETNMTPRQERMAPMLAAARAAHYREQERIAAKFRATLEGHRAQHTPEERYSLGLLADAVEFGYADEETREAYLNRLKAFDA